MGRKKRIKIDEAVTFENVFRIYDGHTETDLFKYLDKEKPLTLEIGCGHGDYSLNLAQLYPERNFVGIDIKPSRIHRGAKKGVEESIKNLAFMVGRAEKLGEVFNPGSVQSIWIPFPDPHVRRRSAFRRLISPDFLNIYRAILTKTGTVNFKTDNENLFEYSKEVLKNENVTIHKLTDNLYRTGYDRHTHEIQTTYEKRYIKEGRIIRFISFSFNDIDQ